MVGYKHRLLDEIRGTGHSSMGPSRGQDTGGHNQVRGHGTGGHSSSGPSRGQDTDGHSQCQFL